MFTVNVCVSTDCSLPFTLVYTVGIPIMYMYNELWGTRQVKLCATRY